jgi:hypothetical protein
VSHFVAEHSRDYPDKGWWLIDHDWTNPLILEVSQHIASDGGPPEAYRSGQGEYEDRPMVEWTFTKGYLLPDGIHIEPGDRARLWLQQ